MKRWHPRWYPRWWGQGAHKPFWDAASDDRRAFYFWSDMAVAIVSSVAFSTFVWWLST